MRRKGEKRKCKEKEKRNKVWGKEEKGRAGSGEEGKRKEKE